MTTPRFTPGPNQDNTFRTVTQDYQNPAYAANIALITTQQYTLVVVQELTGAVTLTANVANPYVGDEMELLFSNGGSSETVTFSTGFNVTAATLVVTGSKYGYIKFIFNGTSWQETARAVTI